MVIETYNRQVFANYYREYDKSILHENRAKDPIVKFLGKLRGKSVEKVDDRLSYYRLIMRVYIRNAFEIDQSFRN